MIGVGHRAELWKAARPMPAAPDTPIRPRLRPVALPSEHGGWALLLEPALAGLVAAPTGAGGLLALAALGAFLARHPLGLALADRRRGRRYPRTALAERVALGYLLVALAALALATLLAPAPFWPALAAAAPLAIAQISADMRRQSRALLAEVAGALALAALAPAMLLAAGREPAAAAALWALVAGRAAPAILYIRARLRRARGEAAPATPALLAHVGALAVAGLLTLAGQATWLAPAAMALLLLRCRSGFSRHAKPTPAVTIGLQELALGIMAAILFGLAVAL